MGGHHNLTRLASQPVQRPGTNAGDGYSCARTNLPEQRIDVHQTGRAGGIYSHMEFDWKSVECGMYLDGVVVAGIVTVVMVFAIFVYLGYYGYQRLRAEEKKAVVRSKENSAQQRD